MKKKEIPTILKTMVLHDKKIVKNNALELLKNRDFKNLGAYLKEQQEFYACFSCPDVNFQIENYCKKFL